MARPRRSLHGYVPKTRDYLACYGLFVLLLPLCYVLFLIWQRTVVVLLALTSSDAYGAAAAVGVIDVLLGIVLFGVVIASEYYLRVGVARRQLLPRFATIAGSLVGVIALGLALQELVIVLH
jgi:hypothetical protein